MIRPAATVVLALAVASPFGGAAHRKTEEGNRLYEEGAFEDALRSYTEAQVDAPEAAELFYDIGNVLYRQGDYEGASEAFTRALVSGSGNLVGAAAYNLGNALFHQDKYREAAESYVRALRFDPADTEAKRNLEIALRALEQQPPSEQQQSDEDREPGEEDGEPEQPAGSSPDDREQEEDDRQQPSSGGDETRQPDGESGTQDRDGVMTEEQARRMLEGTRAQELENLRNHALREIPRTTRPVEEDW